MTLGSAKTCPLLSIVIPTRNRGAYLRSTLRSILAWPDADVEVVIHDNSDSPRLQDMIAGELRDPRVRYVYVPTPLSFCETFERAVGFARGEYVCIIGDDDGITYEAIRVAEWAREQDLDAVVPTLKVVYGWPDFRTRYYGASDAGLMRIRPFSGTITYPDATQELKRSAAHAFQNFCDLPKIYYGFIRQRCIAALREKAGGVFFGASPDLSGAVALASCVKQYCVIDHPIFIPGSSSASGAGRSAMKKHVGSLETTWQTREFAASWPEMIPRFYAVQTVWAQAALAALQATGRTDIVRSFNVPLLHAMSLAYNPAFSKEIMASLPKALAASMEPKIRGTLRFLAGITATMATRFKSHLSRFLGTGYFRFERLVPDLPDMGTAVVVLMKHVQQTGRAFTAKRPEAARTAESPSVTAH